jgi:hypothetical protein
MKRFLLYTDGACTNNAMASKLRCPTGWGVVVLALEKGNEELIAELFGQVELNDDSEYFLGAEIGHGASFPPSFPPSMLHIFSFLLP